METCISLWFNFYILCGYYKTSLHDKSIYHTGSPEILNSHAHILLLQHGFMLLNMFRIFGSLICEISSFNRKKENINSVHVS